MQATARRLSVVSATSCARRRLIRDVMRRKTAIAITSCALMLLAVPWVLRSTRPGGFKPRATLTLLGYDRTNKTSYTESELKEDGIDSATPSLRFGTSPPNPGAQVQTNAGALLARMRLENTGTQPIAFESQGDVPQYACRVQRDGVWADCSGYWLTGGPTMLDVGKAVEFRVWLPPDVTAWQFAFTSHSAGPRLRTALRWHDRGFRGWIPEVVLYALPRGSEAYALLQSDEFAVSSVDKAVQIRELREIR